MTPFQKLTGRAPSKAQTTPQNPIRQFRPIPTGNRTIDEAFRQIIDNQTTLRNNYGPSSVFAVGSGDPVAIPASDTTDGNAFGVSLKLTREGIWIVTASVNVTITSDANQPIYLGLQVDATVIEHFGIGQLSANGQLMLHQSWQIPATGSETCTLVIRKPAAAAGTSTVNPSNSTLTAFWQGL